MNTGTGYQRYNRGRRFNIQSRYNRRNFNDKYDHRRRFNNRSRDEDSEEEGINLIDPYPMVEPFAKYDEQDL